MGVIDAFVYAHNHHRRNLDNSGNFGDSMEGRIRLMTAITPTNAHVYQSICLAGRPLVVLHQKFRLLAAKARYPNLPDSRTTTRKKKATTVKDGPLLQMEELPSLRVKPQLVGALSPARLMEGYISCLVWSSQPNAGARLHSNNTTELSSIN